MKIAIVIPAHNEAAFIRATLDSLVAQSFRPQKIVVVDDHSTDDTPAIVENFMGRFPFVSMVQSSNTGAHMPGSKVVDAFYKGYNSLTEAFDIICKFDADLIFPENYLERMVQIFEEDPQTGMVGGFCQIERDGEWVLENLTNKDHIRGALKAYRKDCFEDIGGLKSSMGWDTVDELLALYKGWKIRTDERLLVKHLKPTGGTYTKAAKWKQGEAFYKLRYDFIITCIASLKLALNKKKPTLAIDYLGGYFLAKRKNLPYLVNKKEGAFIRRLRYKKMLSKLF